MSKLHRKMLNAAINTDSLMFYDEGGKDGVVKPARLKERNVKHIKIGDSSELHGVYSFGEQIGQGSFGTVISVVDKVTEKDWAMKVVNKTAVGNKIQILQREILILKMVEHPHIIYLDKVFESTKKIYLILERCYGELSTIYKTQKPFSEDDTRKIIRDLTSAVAYLHKNDIVHRDLKLENILIARNPGDDRDALFIKVSDFGLSIVKSGSGYEDMLHDCCGTIMYMAPEIVTCHSYSQQCDVWAIGVIMFMLLAGQYPFYSSNEQELMTMLCKSDPVYTGVKCSTEAIHLISKMLMKNPALRITACEALIHPWIVGKPMTDSDSPENVLDMMRLWRSEMMTLPTYDSTFSIAIECANDGSVGKLLELPVGAECDWVSSARAAGSSTDILGKSAILCTLPKVPEKSQDFENSNDSVGRRLSMRLPVKNIRFNRASNENNVREACGKSGGRKSNASVLAVVDSHRNPPTPVPDTSKPTSRSRIAQIAADKFRKKSGGKNKSQVIIKDEDIGPCARGAGRSSN